MNNGINVLIKPKFTQDTIKGLLWVDRPVFELDGKKIVVKSKMYSCIGKFLNEVKKFYPKKTYVYSIESKDPHQFFGEDAEEGVHPHILFVRFYREK